MSANPTSMDILQVLLDSDLSLTTAMNDVDKHLARIGNEPQEGVKTSNRILLTLYDTGGPASNPRYQRDYPRIQVRTLAATEDGYIECYQMQQKIKDILLGFDRFYVGTTLYVNCNLQVDIASLGTGYNNRPVLVSSYRFTREYPTPNRIPIL